MAPNISGSGPVGRSKSTVAKSVAPGAASGSRRKVTPAPGVSDEAKPGRRRSGAGGTSATTTPTGRGGRARSTPAATGRPAAAKRNAKAADVSPPGGVSDFTVVAAVDRDLVEISSRSPELSRSALAMTARQLAQELDSGSSATSKSMCAKALLDVMDRLRELSPPTEKKDGLDDLAARRAARLSGGGSGTTA